MAIIILTNRLSFCVILAGVVMFSSLPCLPADELQDTVGLETTVTVSQGTSRKAVADAVSLVVGSSRNGLVGLCTEVAKIVKANAELVVG